MEKDELIKKLIDNEMPHYILGLDRSYGAEFRFVSHIYYGKNDKMFPEKPMCKKGWNRDNGKSFSIWRNNLGKNICKTCIKNTLKQLKVSNKVIIK